jgi:two-component system, response regulator PdtaR
MEPNATKHEKICVLLVEDEFLIAECVAEYLSQQGFVVHIASNGREALSQLASAHVDVLFTDINLPGGLDGTALARRAREMLPDLPVIYASGRFAALPSEARVPGGVFLRKPYSPEAVGRLIAGTKHSVGEPALA